MCGPHGLLEPYAYGPDGFGPGRFRHNGLRPDGFGTGTFGPDGFGPDGFGPKSWGPNLGPLIWDPIMHLPAGAQILGPKSRISPRRPCAYRRVEARWRSQAPSDLSQSAPASINRWPQL